MTKTAALVLLIAACALSACNRNPLRVVRSACPAVAVPTYAGEVTRFTGPRDDARGVQFTAAITNLRGVCDESGPRIRSAIAFDVIGQRPVAGPASETVLPYFLTVVQGGNTLVAKRLGQVTLRFADGAVRGTGRGVGSAEIARAAITLPADVQDKLARRRKAGGEEALNDPQADPTIRAAIRARSFEVLVGFQLSDEALAHNVAK